MPKNSSGIGRPPWCCSAPSGRQTTLAREISEEGGALYLDLEAREDRAKLAEPALFLRSYEDRLVILDEIEIKRALAARPEKGFHLACEEIRPDRRFIVYPGEGRYPLSAEVDVIGVREIAALLTGA